MIITPTKPKGIRFLIAVFIIHGITLQAQTRVKDEKRFVDALNELTAYSKPSLAIEGEQFILDSLFHIFGDTLSYTRINSYGDTSIARYRYSVALNQISSVGHDLNLVLYADGDKVNIHSQHKGRLDWEYAGLDNLLLVGLILDDDKKGLVMKKKIEAAWKKASRWYQPGLK